MPNIGEAFPRPYQRRDLIASRPRLRADRLLLRARHARRDPRRPRRPDPAGRPRRAAPAHARAHGPLPGVLLRRRAGRAAARLRADERPPRSWSSSAAGRPGWRPRSSCAGAASAEVVVLEREAEPGGIPRHAQHQGFGLRDLRRAAVRARATPAATPSWRARRGRRAAHRDDGHRLVAGRARSS